MEQFGNDYVSGPANGGAAVVRSDGLGGTELVARGETSSTAVAARAEAQIKARYIVAMQRPRNIDAVRQNLLKECRRTTFAQSARYKLPRGGRDDDGNQKFIEGPTIRFAEAAIRCMGNITVETSVVYDDPQKTIVRVSVTDIESNVPYEQEVSIAKTVERKYLKKGQTFISQRTNSYGERVYLVEATDDEILQKTNALISKAVRTLGLRLLPGDILDEAMRLCQQVSLKADLQDPDAAKKQLFDSFFLLGVTVDQLTEYLDGNVGSLTPGEIGDLRAVYEAVRHGDLTWAEVMATKQTAAEATEGGDAQKPAEPTPQQKKAQDAIAAARERVAAKAKNGGQKPAPGAPVPTTGEPAPEKEPMRQPGED